MDTRHTTAEHPAAIRTEAAANEQTGAEGVAAPHRTPARAPSEDTGRGDATTSPERRAADHLIAGGLIGDDEAAPLRRLLRDSTSYVTSRPGKSARPYRALAAVVAVAVDDDSTGDAPEGEGVDRHISMTLQETAFELAAYFSARAGELLARAGGAKPDTYGGVAALALAGRWGSLLNVAGEVE